MVAARAIARPNSPVTLKRLADQIADQHELSKKKSQELLADFVDLAVTHLKQGRRLKLAGLGVLQVRNRAARIGRNPATGEAIQIKASNTVAFRASKELKDAVGGEPTEQIFMDALPPGGGSRDWP